MSLRRSLIPSLLVAAFIAPAGISTAEAGRDQVIVRSGKVMGTRVTLQLWTDSESKAANAVAKVFAEFRRIDKMMTTWLADSQVSQINAAAGLKAIKVDRELFRVIDYAAKMAKTSNGAFDISVGAFRGLWKFDQDRDGSIPDKAAVAKRLRLVGYKNVIVNRKAKTVKLRKKGMRITLGGIAKGYAVDRAVSILHTLGLVDFILQAGGDLYASGRRGHRQWRVGIRDPRSKRDAVFALVAIENATFSTSGDYERSVVKNGVRYHHILDPKTGHPARRCRSVTVKAATAMQADAWSTALFVMGPAAGMKLVERTPGIEAVFVDANNKLHVSSGLKRGLHLLRKPSKGI